MEGSKSVSSETQEFPQTTNSEMNTESGKKETEHQAVSSAPDAKLSSGTTVTASAIVEKVEGDDEEVYTMEQVIEQENLLVETADAVLGDADANACTYDEGYSRQALYACVTCLPPSSDSNSTAGGICLGCSLHCHEGHDLVELYTKRHFRCDCGNERFSASNSKFKCQLMPFKAAVNEENIYGQNFQGKYCLCSKPYPDPDRLTAEIMAQCIICEDWFHEEHMFPPESKLQRLPEEFDEMICGSCMSKHSFLYSYESKAELKELVEVGQEGKCKLESMKELQRETEKVSKAANSAENLPSHAPTFWNHGWRKLLCSCEACEKRYSDHKIEFLRNNSDCLIEHERKSRMKRNETLSNRANEFASNSSPTGISGSSLPSHIAAGTQALNSKFSHAQQVEMAVGYSTMASNLKDYLKGFATSGKTVRAEDIHSFFEELKNKKKQRRT